jgi:hypothetical protein
MRWRYLNRGFANTKLQITQNLISLPRTESAAGRSGGILCLDLPASADWRNA